MIFPYQLVPSATKERISILLAVGVIVGVTEGVGVGEGEQHSE